MCTEPRTSTLYTVTAGNKTTLSVLNALHKFYTLNMATHKHTCLKQCSHARVGLAQPSPNNLRTEGY